MSRLFVGLTALALIVGVTTAAPVPVHIMPKGPRPYFPTWVGAKWEYTDGTRGVFGEITWVTSVTAVEDTDAGVMVTVSENKTDGTKVPIEKVLVTTAGLKQVERDRKKPATPQWLLKIPFTAEQKWDVDYSTDGWIDKGDRTVLGTEEVKVPAGKFVAVGVESQLVSGPPGEGPIPALHHSFIEWYAPGIGVIKRERRGNPPWVLMSFTP